MNYFPHPTSGARGSAAPEWTAWRSDTHQCRTFVEGIAGVAFGGNATCFTDDAAIIHSHRLPSYVLHLSDGQELDTRMSTIKCITTACDASYSRHHHRLHQHHGQCGIGSGVVIVSAALWRNQLGISVHGVRYVDIAMLITGKIKKLTSMNGRAYQPCLPRAARRAAQRSPVRACLK